MKKPVQLIVVCLGVSGMVNLYGMDGSEIDGSSTKHERQKSKLPAELKKDEATPREEEKTWSSEAHTTFNAIVKVYKLAKDSVWPFDMAWWYHYERYKIVFDGIEGGDDHRKDTIDDVTKKQYNKLKARAERRAQQNIFQLMVDTHPGVAFGLVAVTAAIAGAVATHQVDQYRKAAEEEQESEDAEVQSEETITIEPISEADAK